MAEPAAKPIPRATYRLQFRKEFGFSAATELAPYLANLGVSHVYASPYLMARPGSTHGYDIVDHNELNPELGSREDFDRMVAAFRGHGLGQILDFVPNHMGVGGADNIWWLDVLEWGPRSEFADWFDIEWHPDRRYLDEKLLIPFLGEQYGAALERGTLELKFDPAAGSFAVWAYDTHKLPVSPLHYGRILGRRHPEVERLGDSFTHLPVPRRDVGARAAELKLKLAELVRRDAEVAGAVETAVERFRGEPGNPESWTRLHLLIQDQSWRPTYFRVAADDINYRRFFNVNELAGVRVEIPEVFDHTHHLVLRLLDEGVLDGLRLDHVDGLLDPKAYCRKLREKAPRPFYLVVEKILAGHESLRLDWNVDGTTGYEFANLLTGLLVDPAGEEPLSRAYTDFTGLVEAFPEVVRDCKHRIMENEMTSELNVLAREAGRVARSHPRSADFTNNVLHRALKQVIACFPVYRTYVDGEPLTESDRRDIDWAVAVARRTDTSVDPSVFDFLHKLLTTDLAEPGSGFSRVAVTRAAMRVQQYSGPVMAKGLEDTAFYRYNRLLALNEVGGNPDRFGVSVAQFHGANQQRLKTTPHALLSTSTHDAKRGEDARARLAVLSEIPEEWAERVSVWSRILRALEAGSGMRAPPDQNDEYAFYQLLLAAWPPDLSRELEPAALESFRQRIEAAMTKSIREAKLHTTWALPNLEYEEAVIGFVRRALDASRSSPFLEDFLSFVAKVAPLGVWNSLVQTVLKLTVPGVPDIYQGAELWNFSLVDPDNRRPVDFDERQQLLQCLRDRGAGDLPRLMHAWHDGAIKLLLISNLLRLRGEQSELFNFGSYQPIGVEGPAGPRICAFARRANGAALIVSALLYPSRGQADLAETRLALPSELQDLHWKNRFDGRKPPLRNGSISAAELFSSIPAAVLFASA